jgi:hypothetical protein
MPGFSSSEMKMQLPAFFSFLLPFFLLTPMEMNWNLAHPKGADLDVLEFSFSCSWKMWIPKDWAKHLKAWFSLPYTDCLAVGLCQLCETLPSGASLLSCFSVARVEAGCHWPAWEMIFIDHSPPPTVSPLSLPVHLRWAPIICEWRRGTLVDPEEARNVIISPSHVQASCIFPLFPFMFLLVACFLLLACLIVII